MHYGHQTELDANFVLALSLPYWPINQMSEVNSRTQKPDSNIHKPPTIKLDCIKANYNSHEKLMKTEKKRLGFGTMAYLPVNQVKYFLANLKYSVYFCIDKYFK